MKFKKYTKFISAYHLNNMEDEMDGAWDKYDPSKEPR